MTTHIWFPTPLWRKKDRQDEGTDRQDEETGRRKDRQDTGQDKGQDRRHRTGEQTKERSEQ